MSPTKKGAEVGVRMTRSLVASGGNRSGGVFLSPLSRWGCWTPASVIGADERCSPGRVRRSGVRAEIPGDRGVRDRQRRAGRGAMWSPTSPGRDSLKA